MDEHGSSFFASLTGDSRPRRRVDRPRDPLGTRPRLPRRAGRHHHRDPGRTRRHRPQRVRLACLVRRKSPLGLLTEASPSPAGSRSSSTRCRRSAVSSLVALYMIIDGGSGILFASDLGDDEERTWIRGDAWLSIALGVSMWVGWPLSGLRALGVLVGMKLVSAGAVVLRLERGMQRVGAGVAALRSRLGR